MAQKTRRPNSGILTVNKSKEKDSHPDFVGDISSDKKDYTIAGWNNVAKRTGNKYFGLKVSIEDGKLEDTVDRDNSGVLFKNDRKKSDRSPDYTGSVTIEGKEHWLNAWKRQNQSGVSFLSLSMFPKNELASKAEEPTHGQSVSSGSDDFDDIPF